jgi:hypothetical protein
VSGSPLQCAQLHQRIRPLRGPCPDGGRHLPVNAPAYGGDPGVDQLLGDCAVKAWQLVSGAGHRSQSNRGARLISCGPLAINYKNRYVV